MRPGYDRVRISSKELKKIEPFMAFASSAFAVRPTLDYGGKYLNADGFT
jgi:hypothetical protein